MSISVLPARLTIRYPTAPVVILSEAKNLALGPDSSEILRFAQNDSWAFSGRLKITATAACNRLRHAKRWIAFSPAPGGLIAARTDQ
jgi:hypothetical protein